MSGRRPFRIIIAGCGPAGLSAALFLARAGHSVQLYDQLERPQPLGSGLVLQPTGRAVLGALGLEAEAIDLGNPLHKMWGTLRNGRVVLDVSYHTGQGPAGGDYGLAMHRGALFDLLYRAVLAQGIPIETHWRASGARQDSDCVRLTGADGRETPAADLLVDAMGLRSPLSEVGPNAALPYGALWATLDWVEGLTPREMLVQRYERCHRMAGVINIGRARETGREQAAFFWSIRNDAVDAWQQAGLEAWKRDVLSLWPEVAPYLDQIRDSAELTYARYAHFTPATPLNGRIVRLGDSAHCTSPQLGQGANMALIDAAALAHGLAQGADLPAALEIYRSARRLHVALYQAISKVFTPFYQSSSRLLPPIRDFVLQPASRIWPAPHLLGMLARGEIGDPLGRVGLAAVWDAGKINASGALA